MKEIQLQRVAPADIEARSMELITQELGDRVFPADQLPVVKRVIHTTADFEYADNLVFSPGAVEKGIAAMKAGCTIVTDTQMAFSGVNKRVLEKFGGRAMCFMSDPDVAAEARGAGGDPGHRVHGAGRPPWTAPWCWPSAMPPPPWCGPASSWTRGR